MNITVQTATRGREKILPLYVENVFSMCRQPENVEMIFYVDVDDDRSQKVLKALPVKVIVGPRGKGYCDHSRFHTEIAKVAKGKLLMQANDDMLLKTKGWDNILWETSRRYPDNVFVLKMTGDAYPERMPFPVIHRMVVEMMGCFSPPNVPWIDRFLWTVMHRLNRFIPVASVETKHQRLGNYSYLEKSEVNSDVVNSPDERNRIQEAAVCHWVNVLGKLIS